MKSGSLSLSTVAKSSKIAVWPPIRTSTRCSALLACGTTSERRWWRSFVVEASCGEPAGYASAMGDPGMPVGVPGDPRSLVGPTPHDPPSVVGHGGDDLRESGLLGRIGVDLCDELERGRCSRARKALGQQVVGAAASCCSRGRTPRLPTRAAWRRTGWRSGTEAGARPGSPAMRAGRATQRPATSEPSPHGLGSLVVSSPAAAARVERPSTRVPKNPSSAGSSVSAATTGEERPRSPRRRRRRGSSRRARTCRAARCRR